MWKEVIYKANYFLDSKNTEVYSNHSPTQQQQKNAALSDSGMDTSTVNKLASNSTI